MKPKTLGIVFILLASVMWAIETIFAKLAYTASTAPDFRHTVAIRTIVVAIIAFLYLFFFNISNFKRLLAVKK